MAGTAISAGPGGGGGIGGTGDSNPASWLAEYIGELTGVGKSQPAFSPVASSPKPAGRAIDIEAG
jgi:hypothetical protein